MPHPIPEPYKWDKTFEVFYANIDEEHKQIFNGIFDLINTNNQANLKALIAVTRNHFTEEEGMMKKVNYSEFDGHKKKHDSFLADLDALVGGDKVGQDKIDFAKTWLVEHIMETDFKYKGKL